MKFVVHQDRCVGCLACARVCPTGAIAVPESVATVSITDPSCIRCGLCLPACPEDAISALGNLEMAQVLAGRPGTVLILGTEAVAHFHPATPEQVVNACYAAGFTMVSRGVLGDELVARDKASLDIFWLKDESLADSDNLPPPEVIAQEIVDDLEAALEQFRLIAADLNGSNGRPDA